MQIKKFIKAEFDNWGKYEKVTFPVLIVFITFLSFILNDDKTALISAICGITYTILAGKGKISCYLFGITGTVCYSIIAYKNTLYGNLALNLLYYLPVQIIGVLLWKNHLKKDRQEIIKTKLTRTEFKLFLASAVILSAITAVFLAKTNDFSPVIDAFTTIFSILGLILTVKRCLEQWYIWTFVNLLSVIIWTNAYINSSNCFATIVMWSAYLILGLYFMHTWKQELQKLSA